VHKTVVINAVGLTPSLIGTHTPRLRDFVARGRLATIEPVLPAVTCSVQSTYLTGAWPGEHGIVGNGWYDRTDCEIKFWKQSNKLVQRPKVWETQRQINASGFTVANMFWWYNMYSTADIAVTPRPMYPSDGRKLPDIHTFPANLRDELQRELGQFPLFFFWGPASDIRSTRWIVDATLHVARKHDPTLTLVYLPHLDYDLQRFGPSAPQAMRAASELDVEVGRLIDFYSERGHCIIILSEYGIEPVSRPVHLNRALRENGLITVREELGRELLDPGLSDAFAVADHQVAHVYLNNLAKRERVREILQRTPGVARVYEPGDRAAIHLDHERAGDFVVLAEPDAWFTYYYWLDEARRPDFANAVDIHRKPGYDPVELFLDPAIKMPKVTIGWTLLKRKLGFRAGMNVISTDATLVKGSHGLPAPSPDRGPLLVSNTPDRITGDRISPVAVRDIILTHLNS
jgi:predicted AlkP superfamily pyrophosphatase or phosphodiesterase